MDKKECIRRAEQVLMHTYGRYQVVLDHGEGVYLYDTDGKKYLDFAAGIAVCALGYSNEAYKNALKEQVENLVSFTVETFGEEYPEPKSSSSITNPLS